MVRSFVKGPNGPGFRRQNGASGGGGGKAAGCSGGACSTCCSSCAAKHVAAGRAAGELNFGTLPRQRAAATGERAAGLYSLDDPFTDAGAGGNATANAEAQAAGRRALNEVLASIDPSELPPEDVWARMNVAQRETWVRNFARQRNLNQAQTTELVTRVLTQSFGTLRDYLHGEYQVRLAQIGADERVAIARLNSQARAEQGVINGMNQSSSSGSGSSSSASGSSELGLLALALLAAKYLF